MAKKKKKTKQPVLTEADRILERHHFMAENDEGELVECEMLFTFDSPRTGRDYIVYTDGSVGEDGNTSVFAAIYDPATVAVEGEGMCSMTFAEIETDEEWDVVEAVLADMEDELEAALEAGREGDLEAGREGDLEAGREGELGGKRNGASKGGAR